MPRKNVVIGTAGHIDHGKTALVNLLTGIDTDRLKEEKERGISIDLGFAHLALPSGMTAGIVDVPGHERFVRNMLAGAGGIDIVLFVVAADEGVMPQTREHLDIVDILRVHGGVVALTKIDLVDGDWITMVRSEVCSLISGTVLEDAAVIPISSISGEGKNDILAALDSVARRLGERVIGKSARLPIDRVFTVEGFGTVVTGTLWSGFVKSGDSLEALPIGKKVRVRNVQVFGKDVAEALPGQRVALALHGISREELKRGDWLLAPGSLSPSSIVDVRFDLLEDVSRPLKNRDRVRFHLGASEVLGRIYFLDRELLTPGESALAQLRFESSVLAAEGDRFVIRSYSPQITLGGGSVLVSHSRKHKRKERALELLTLVEQGSPSERAEHAIHSSGEKGVHESELAAQAGLEALQAEEAIRTLSEECRVHKVGHFLIHDESLCRLKQELADSLRDYQKSYRLRWGMGKGELRNRFRRISGEFFSALLGALAKEGKLFRKEDKYRVDSPDLNLSPQEVKLKERIERELLRAGFNVPTFRELGALGEEGKISDTLQILAEEGKVIRVTSELYFHSAGIGEAEELLKAFLVRNGKMQVTDFKNLLKITRKFAVPLLEYFDRKGTTRRDGDVRVLTAPEQS